MNYNSLILWHGDLLTTVLLVVSYSYGWSCKVLLGFTILMEGVLGGSSGGSGSGDPGKSSAYSLIRLSTNSTLNSANEYCTNNIHVPCAPLNRLL